jgi:hypothetical protein
MLDLCGLRQRRRRARPKGQPRPVRLLEAVLAEAETPGSKNPLALAVELPGGVRVEMCAVGRRGSGERFLVQIPRRPQPDGPRGFGLRRAQIIATRDRKERKAGKDTLVLALSFCASFLGNTLFNRDLLNTRAEILTHLDGKLSL